MAGAHCPHTNRLEAEAFPHDLNHIHPTALLKVRSGPGDLRKRQSRVEHRHLRPRPPDYPVPSMSLPSSHAHATTLMPHVWLNLALGPCEQQTEGVGMGGLRRVFRCRFPTGCFHRCSLLSQTRAPFLLPSFPPYLRLSIYPSLSTSSPALSLSLSRSLSLSPSPSSNTHTHAR